MVDMRRFPALARAPASEEQLLALARVARDLAEFWIDAVFLRADFRFSDSADECFAPAFRLRPPPIGTPADTSIPCR